MSARRRLSLGERLVIAAPYLWIGAFFLAPMLLIAKISVSQSVLARPPYRPIFEPSDSLAAIWAKAQTFSFDAYRALVERHSLFQILSLVAHDRGGRDARHAARRLSFRARHRARARAPAPRSDRLRRRSLLDELSHSRLRLDRAAEG